MTDDGAGSFTAQLGGAGQNWGLTGAYRYGQCGTDIRSGTQYTYALSKLKCADLNSGAATNSFALNGYWQPSQSGWVPSISAGWGITGFTDGYEANLATQQFPERPVLDGRSAVERRVHQGQLRRYGRGSAALHHLHLQR